LIFALLSSRLGRGRRVRESGRLEGLSERTIRNAASDETTSRPRRKGGRNASTSGPSVGGDRGVLRPRVGSKIRNRPHYILFVRFVIPQFSLRRRFFSGIAPFFDKKSYFVEDAVRENGEPTPIASVELKITAARFNDCC
jgi:hypothetical protein